jgi:hypothetical protein
MMVEGREGQRCPARSRDKNSARREQEQGEVGCSFPPVISLQNVSVYVKSPVIQAQVPCSRVRYRWVLFTAPPLQLLYRSYCRRVINDYPSLYSSSCPGNCLLRGRSSALGQLQAHGHLEAMLGQHYTVGADYYTSGPDTAISRGYRLCTESGPRAPDG